MTNGDLKEFISYVSWMLCFSSVKRKETHLPALTTLGSLTDLEGSLNGIIIYLRRKKKLRRGHRSLARRIKIEPACYISYFKCDLTALSDELTTSCFSLEEIDC